MYGSKPFYRLLEGKNAFVVGATGELGRGAAHALSAAGAYVYLAGRLDDTSAIQQALPYPELSSVIPVDYTRLHSDYKFESLLNHTFPEPVLDVVLAWSDPWWWYRTSQNTLSNDDQTNLTTQPLLNETRCPYPIDMPTETNYAIQLRLHSILYPKLRPTTGHYMLVNGATLVNDAVDHRTDVSAITVKRAANFMSSRDWYDTHYFTYVRWRRPAKGYQTIRDPNEYGKAFVAVALDTGGTHRNSPLWLNDGKAAKLIAGLPM